MAKPPDEDEEPSTPPTAKRKPSTPRKASIKTPNGPRTPARKTSANKNPTQTQTPRRPSANANMNKTPASAPARGTKKAEPTLLGDFLLGRPSPARQRMARRKSLEGVKMEMRAELVGRMRQPGKVKERVKEWQKAVMVPVEVGEIVVEVEVDSSQGSSVSEDDEVDGTSSGDERARRDSSKRPGRRKSPVEKRKDEREKRSKSAVAPRKRVISDSHWMKKPEKEKEKEKEKPVELPKKVNRIPKDFLQKTASNPPVERKIEDWIGRTPVLKPSSPHVDTETKRDSSQRGVAEDGIRITPSGSVVYDGIRIRPSKDRPDDDGIRIKPSPSDDGTPTRRSKKRSNEAGIQIKPSRDNSPGSDVGSKHGSKRRSMSYQELQNPRQRTSKHLRPPPSESKRASSYGTTHMDMDEEETDKFSWMSPSPPENSKHQKRKSGSPTTIDDIPFGNSAFSVLDLPVGAEAGTMRRPAPKRNNSFAAVPKVLKRVYTEGMKIVHDAPEPARGGPNQPPSIESWLNKTTDPFVDRPTSSASTLEVPETTGRRRSYKEDDEAERELTAEHDEDRDSRPNRRRQKSPENDQSSPLTPKHRETLPSQNSPPISPSGLRRTPATRNVTSPKASKRTPLKEAIFDAFKGESAMKGKPAASPFDFIGLRERDINRVPEYDSRDIDSNDEHTPTQSSRRSSASRPKFEEPVNDQANRLPPFPHGPAPTTGAHRLSTIVSVETFSTSSSLTESTADTGSDVSQTTVTQDTVFTAPTSSSLSRKSTKNGLKRRLTKHSDLISLLSLPDSPQVERSKSIQSARSIRTTRRHLESATVQDLMRELAEDETKYMRELNTLVDGVIPVLLTSVLSKSDSALAAGLLDPDSTSNSSFTKPIVDMGVALERLRSLHRRVPIDDPDHLLHWLHSAQKIYEDYLFAWRTGFEGVVVNLAPTHRGDQDKMRRNTNGDVVNENGEVVDVAYLLKRPVVRIKYLARVIKGLHNLKESDLSKLRLEQMQGLEALARRRAKEETARREDQRANDTDATRARDLRTLGPIEDVKINRTRQVAAKDSFSFELPHSSGQKIECQVDMLLRDTPSDPKDADILIIEVGTTGRFLLFPPMEKSSVSARIGDHDCQLVIMNRGVVNNEPWSELFVLETNDPAAAKDWVDMLGTKPLPPPLVRKQMALDPQVASELDALDNKSIASFKLQGSDDMPIGERRRRAEEETSKQRRRGRQERGPSTLYECLEENPSHSDLGELCILDVKDLNEAREKAGSLPLTLPQKRPTPARYHGKNAKIPAVMAGALMHPVDTTQDSIDRKDELRAEKIRPGSPSTPEKKSTSLRDSMRPDAEMLKNSQSPGEDVPPPPPAHRTPSPSTLNKAIPILETPTPKAKNRRTSSPLKHEWQPSDASLTSSSSEHSSDSDSYSSDSSEDELEAIDSPTEFPPPLVVRKPSPPDSIYNVPAASIAPSNSASQAPNRNAPFQQTNGTTRRTVARISTWKNDGLRSCWVDLWPEICSIVVTPGRIEAYELTAAHSSPVNDNLESTSDLNSEIDAGVVRPLIAQDLTPHVVQRQSTAIDIEITSPPLSQSRLKCAGTIRFRAVNTTDAHFLYSACHYARLTNAVFLKLEEERKFAAYGTNPYLTMNAHKKRRWFGRQPSYRASARAPQSEASSQQSGMSSVLKRLSGNGLFNIARSSLDRSGPISNSTSTSSSDSGTPPGTPGSPSMADSSAYSQSAVQNLGWEDIPITLSRLATSSKWDILGAAFLTVSTPPPTMRPESSQNYGLLRRITVTRRPLHLGAPTGPAPAHEAGIMLDVVVGVGCFNLLSRKGVLMHDWRDIRGNDGQVGVIGSTGGVSATMGKYLFQTERGVQRDWIWSLTGGLYDRGAGARRASWMGSAG